MIEKKHIYHITGNPFVDAGIISLCALNKKETPEEITRDDLKNSVKKIVRYYSKWRKLRNLFTQNHPLLNPSIKYKKRKYENYLENLIQIIQSASSSGGTCAACGSRKANNNEKIYREKLPLTGSGDLLNFFSFFDSNGFPLCGACMFALQFLPLYLIANDGKLFLAHSSNIKIMITLANNSIKKITGNSACGAKLTFYCPIEFSKNEINECAVKLARHIIAISEAIYGDEAPVIRLYSFINLGQINLIDFVDIPSKIFQFLEESKLGGLGRSLDELLKNSSKDIFRKLIQEQSIRYYFINLKKRKIIGGWELFERYLIMVDKMEKERIEVIKRVGERLFNYLKNKNFKNLRDFETNNFKEFNMALSRAQKETLIWTIDEYSVLFPQDRPWTETQHVLLGYIYERMHKNKEVVK